MYVECNSVVNIGKLLDITHSIQSVVQMCTLKYGCELQNCIRNINFKLISSVSNGESNDTGNKNFGNMRCSGLTVGRGVPSG